MFFFFFFFFFSRSSVDQIVLNPAMEEFDPNKKPEFIIKPRKQFADEGKVAKFKASFEGVANVNWERHGQLLQQGDKYKVSGSSRILVNVEN